MSKTNKLSLTEVKHIAKLVNLTLTEKEIEKLALELGNTIEYIKNLSQIDTSKVIPTYQTTGNLNRFSNESTGDRTLSQVDALKNAPFSKNSLFQIKGLDYQK